MATRQLLAGLPLQTVRVSREGHQPIELAVEQLTPRSIATVFSLDPTTLWLREADSMNNRAFFPDTNSTQFVLSDDVGFLITELVAMGTPVQVGSGIPSANFHPNPKGSSSSSASSESQYLIPQQTQFIQSKKSSSTNVKIVQATLKRLSSGKVEFTAQNQTFIDVTEATANLHYVSTAMQRTWGVDYILVTADGLKLDDSSGTQGLKFWKIGSRKLYAVKEVDLRESRKAPNNTNIYSSSSDDDFVSPRLKRRRAESVSSDLKQIKEGVDKIFSLT